MKGYKVTIINLSDETLSAKERIMLKDTSDCDVLGDMSPEAEIIIDVDKYALLKIENSKAEEPEYNTLVIIDKSGKKYSTSSQNFADTFYNIADELMDCNIDDFKIKVYLKPSKNYKGKYFLTCSLI